MIPASVDQERGGKKGREDKDGVECGLLKPLRPFHLTLLYSDFPFFFPINQQQPTHLTAVPSQSKDLWILGGMFLERFVVSFDFDAKRMGVAEPVGKTQEGCGLSVNRGGEVVVEGAVLSTPMWIYNVDLVAIGTCKNILNDIPRIPSIVCFVWIICS